MHYFCSQWNRKMVGIHSLDSIRRYTWSHIVFWRRRRQRHRSIVVFLFSHSTSLTFQLEPQRSSQPVYFTSLHLLTCFLYSSFVLAFCHQWEKNSTEYLILQYFFKYTGIPQTLLSYSLVLISVCRFAFVRNFLRTKFLKLVVKLKKKKKIVKN